MQRVEKLFLEQCAAGAFPGGQLVVQRGKQRELDLAVGIASGFRADEGPRISVTNDTRFQVMSASKAVLARCIALLEARGQLDVNATVRAYIPEFGAADVTVLDVLTHRSGFTMPVLSAHPERWSDWANVVAALRDEPPAFRRGTLAYQPIAFGWILTELLQRISGRSLAQFCAAEVGASLDWMTTGETAKTYWLGKPSYMLNGSNLAADFEPTNNGISARSALVPGAGMYTSARSLAQFYSSLLEDDSATFHAYTRVQTSGMDKITGAYVVLGRGFGLGWRLPHPYGWWNSQRSFGHCGGFSVVAYADRATNAAVAIVTNGNRGVSDLVRRFAPLSSAIRRALQRS